MKFFLLSLIQILSLPFSKISLRPKKIQVFTNQYLKIWAHENIFLLEPGRETIALQTGP